MPMNRGCVRMEGPPGSASGAEINHVSEAWVPSWFCPSLGLSPPQSRRMVTPRWVMADGQGSAWCTGTSGPWPLCASVFLSENGNDYSSWLLELLGVGVRVTEVIHIDFQGSLGTMETLPRVAAIVTL